MGRVFSQPVIFNVFVCTRRLAGMDIQKENFLIKYILFNLQDDNPQSLAHEAEMATYAYEQYMKCINQPSDHETEKATATKKGFKRIFAPFAPGTPQTGWFYRTIRFFVQKDRS